MASNTSKGYGRGLGGGNKPGSGPGGNCICPNCGKKIPHKTAAPCSTKVCPNCNTWMQKE